MTITEDQPSAAELVGIDIPIHLTDEQLAAGWRPLDETIRPCECSHDIDDHTPHPNTWLQGARTVTVTSMPCDLCDCTDFEESDQ